MSITCKKCGIADEVDQQQRWFCLKYKKELTVEEVSQEHDCSFFIPIRYENDEALSSFEHLLLKEQEVTGKKMKGPI